jgi:hypothetical protein
MQYVFDRERNDALRVGNVWWGSLCIIVEQELQEDGEVWYQHSLLTIVE